MPPKHLPHPFNILVDTFFGQPPPAHCTALAPLLHSAAQKPHSDIFSLGFPGTPPPPFLGDTSYLANLSWKLEEGGLVFDGKSV